jgi:hypothetical protein
MLIFGSRPDKGSDFWLLSRQQLSVRLPRCVGRQTLRLGRPCSPGKEMLARVVAMPTRLVDRFDTDNTRVRKDSLPS